MDMEAVLGGEEVEEVLPANSFYVRTTEVVGFCGMLNSMMDLVLKMRIHISAEGMRICEQAANNTLLITAKFPADRFECFKCDGPSTVCFEPASLYKFLNRHKQNSETDVMYMCFKKDRPTELVVGLLRRSRGTLARDDGDDGDEEADGEENDGGNGTEGDNGDNRTDEREGDAGETGETGEAGGEIKGVKNLMSRMSIRNPRKPKKQKTGTIEAEIDAITDIHSGEHAGYAMVLEYTLKLLRCETNLYTSLPTTMNYVLAFDTTRLIEMIQGFTALQKDFAAEPFVRIESSRTSITFSMDKGYPTTRAAVTFLTHTPDAETDTGRRRRRRQDLSSEPLVDTSDAPMAEHHTVSNLYPLNILIRIKSLLSSNKGYVVMYIKEDSPLIVQVEAGTLGNVRVVIMYHIPDEEGADGAEAAEDVAMGVDESN